jgi:cytochrome c oxidase subunit 1
MKLNPTNDQPENASGGSIGSDGPLETSPHAAGRAANGARVEDPMNRNAGAEVSFDPHQKLGVPFESYLNNDFSWKSWVYTLDHKRIGLMYLLFCR